MASTGRTDTLTRKRILANVQERRKGDQPEAPPEEDVAVESRADDAERILSQPVKIGQKKKSKRRKRPPRGRSAAQIALLGAIVIVGIAAIIGLRYMAEAFGVNWVGD